MGVATFKYDTPLSLQRSFNEMQTWITELRQLGPQNLVLAIAGNKLDLESSRQVS